MSRCMLTIRYRHKPAGVRSVSRSGIPATWYPLAFSTAAASCRIGSLSVAWAAAASEPASLNAMAVRRSATWQRAPVVVEPVSPAHGDNQQASLLCLPAVKPVWGALLLELLWANPALLGCILAQYMPTET